METLSKRCPKCELTKDISEFHKNKSRPGGYCSECKLCVLTRAKRNYNADPEKHRLKVQRWRDANPGKSAEVARNSRKRHPEAVKASQKKYKAANKEKMASMYRQWYEANYDKVLEANRKARAKKRNVYSEPYSTQDIIDEWGKSCHLCGVEIDLSLPRRDPLGLHLDHVIPLSKNGPDIIANVKPAHSFCNLSKKDKLTPSALSELAQELQPLVQELLRDSTAH